MRRLLIANRAEIVCRIARTARRLGITSIAVYSDADRGALHVRSCDEAYRLGESPAADSYLNIGRIIELALKVGADAVHPGYGFLSENAQFAEACTAAGLTFVGPPAQAIRAMGSKSASKAAMARVGVPVAPGYHGDEQSVERLTAEARQIGFPLIIKASAGGGGKGMKVVAAEGEMREAVESAKRLALTAFGNDHVLMERYFDTARHVEVQVFADTHGQVLSLFDRDCSVQRRHQKILEEAPAPHLREEVRRAMSEAALQAARAVGYVGAGTVEFLVDQAQNFYFMEMNTRLQVEHPVTECITGLDLVEWQLRVAAGEALPCAAGELRRRGHAIEARLYAEDPGQGYLPSVGRITHLRWPAAAPGLRLDIGVEAGDEVSSYYDPMLGKLIAWAETRDAALKILRQGLMQLEIAGVTVNRALLVSILAEQQFQRGGVGTNYLALTAAALEFAEPQPDALDLALAALWCAAARGAPDDLWNDSRGWRLSVPARSRRVFDAGSVWVEWPRSGPVTVRGASGSLQVALLSRSESSIEVEVEGRVQRAQIVQDENAIHLYRDGRHVRLVERHTEDSLAGTENAEQGSLLTPLPGTVVAVHVTPGQSVTRGAPLVTVEAMKMEHTLTAPHAGVVSRIAYGVSDRVAAGAVLIELAQAT